jgi:histidinol phosphatase-like enzyme
LVKICCHTLEQSCYCRRPKRAPRLEPASALGISLENSHMVGDCISNVEASWVVECRTIFIDLGYTNEPKPGNASFAVSSTE